MLDAVFQFDVKSAAESRFCFLAFLLAFCFVVRSLILTFYKFTIPLSMMMKGSEIAQHLAELHSKVQNGPKNGLF